MNAKELLVIVLLALVTTWGVEYFLFKKKLSSSEERVQSGQTFVAPKTYQELKPLNVEIDFVDVKRSSPVVRTEVVTPRAHFYFSTDGAILEKIEFNRSLQEEEFSIATILPAAVTERERGCFLVALQEKTPYFYELIDRVDEEETTRLIYQASHEVGIIKKEFVVFHNKDLITMNLTIHSDENENIFVEPRIFYPAPVMLDLSGSMEGSFRMSKKDEEPSIIDKKSLVVVNERGSVVKIAQNNLTEGKGWFSPTFFGFDNRYFAHIMINDQNQFTQRAYFSFVGKNDMFAILEGPPVTPENNSWTLSFYFGPKEVKSMGLVDAKLEGILDFAGFLAPISKALLALLNFLYSYLKNYGLAIIVLTLLIKLLLFPITMRGEQGMKKHKEAQKKLKYIEQRYKHDKERLAYERAEHIKQHGMPGLSGCLPQLLQLPIFFALNRVLSSSIELYRAPFVGWIVDLSSPDPYYILPILITVFMFVQALNADAQTLKMMLVIGLVFGAFAVNFAAGLCLYIMVNVILTVLQTFIQKKMKVV